MEANSIKLIQKTDAFDTAKENMAFDESLLESLNPNQRIERFYIWKTPGITYSYKQQCPNNMIDFDYSSRLTGGGIVFHSPGDIVFSIIGWREDAFFKGSLKTVLDKLSYRIKDALRIQKVPLDDILEPHEVNLKYCHQYPTPFEITVNNQKVVGLTIRQFKSKRLIQGIIHTKPSAKCFQPFFNISINIDHNQLLNSLLK